MNRSREDHSSTQLIFEERARYGGLRAVIDPNDRVGRRNYYLDRLSSRIIKEGIPSHANRLLDFGCGNGRLLRRIARSRINDLWGVDITPSLIEEARRIVSLKERVHFEVIEPALPYPLASEYFDAVICCWVFQHINDDEVVRDILKELFRLLKKGGILVTFDRTSPKRMVQDLNGRPYTTIRTMAEEEALAKETGFLSERTRIVWIAGRLWQRILSRFDWPVWWPFIPAMAWWDLHLCRHPLPKEGERAECLYIFKKPE